MRRNDRKGVASPGEFGHSAACCAALLSGPEPVPFVHVVEHFVGRITETDVVGQRRWRERTAFYSRLLDEKSVENFVERRLSGLRKGHAFTDAV